jgi:multidrug resistance efflux pump
MTLSMNAVRRSRPLPARVTARSAEIQGQVICVAAPGRGIVRMVAAAEKQVVRKGDLLLEMRSAVPDRNLPAALQASWTAVLRSREVRAPVDGRVVQVEVGTDQFVERSQPVFAILQSDDVWIVADFHPDFLEGIQPGQRATVKAGGLELTARIEFVAADGSALLEFEQDELNPAEILLPGFPAEVTIDLDQSRLRIR